LPGLAILNSLKRTTKIRDDARKLYLLYEGKNTEPLFINSLIMNSNIVNKRDAYFLDLLKTKRDVGKTSPFSLIELAMNFKKDKNKFRTGFDKVMIFFDLDVFHNDQKEINKLLKIIDHDIILCYTNPSIELFLLLTRNGSYEKYIEPNEKLILENNYYKNTDKRYIYHLATKVLKINTKGQNPKIALLATDFNRAFYQEKYLNHYLNKSSKKLTSNIGYVFNKISNNDYDIRYNKK